jgi:REP element-mobilizing transposase RayT
MPGTPTLEADPRRAKVSYARMDQGSYTLDEARREIVLDSIKDICAHHSWYLLAAHVRMTHVHVVVEADWEPGRVINALKADASQCLNRAGLDAPDRKRWTRHGSTRYLRDPVNVAAAINYVVHDQGEAMAVFESTAP